MLEKYKTKLKLLENLILAINSSSNKLIQKIKDLMKIYSQLDLINLEIALSNLVVTRINWLA